MGAKEHVVAVPLIVIHVRLGVSKRLLPIFTSSPNGSSNAGLRRSPWNRRGSTGSPFMRSLRSEALRCGWSMHGMSRTCPGRTKTDVLIASGFKLHSFGLLSGSSRPDQQIRTLRSLMRLRDNLVVESAQSVHHMQKALFEMNVQLSNVISDIVGRAECAFSKRSWPGSTIQRGWRHCAVLALKPHERPSPRAYTATGARSSVLPARGPGFLPLRSRQNRRVRCTHY